MGRRIDKNNKKATKCKIKIDFLKSESHGGTSQFIQHNLDFNLIPTITRPTRVQGTAPP